MPRTSPRLRGDTEAARLRVSAGLDQPRAAKLAARFMGRCGLRTWQAIEAGDHDLPEALLAELKKRATRRTQTLAAQAERLRAAGVEVP